jgi:hypothetical protein
MQVATTGNSIRKTGAKIDLLWNVLKRSLGDFSQNNLIYSIGTEVTGIIGNYDVESHFQNSVSSGWT